MSAVNRGGYEKFLHALGEQESRNDYRSVNTLGFLGRFQMGEALLKDLRFYDANPYYNGGGNGVARNNWHGTWTSKANRYGVNSQEDFLGSETMQNAVIKEALQHNLTNIKGQVGGSAPLRRSLRSSGHTLSGALAAAHLRGATGAVKYIQNREQQHDEYGTSIASYATKFSGYDVAQELGHDDLRGY